MARLENNSAAIVSGLINLLRKCGLVEAAETIRQKAMQNGCRNVELRLAKGLLGAVLQACPSAQFIRKQQHLVTRKTHSSAGKALAPAAAQPAVLAPTKTALRRGKNGRLAGTR